MNTPTISIIPAPTNLYELATFPEPIFSDRFFFSYHTHPASFVSSILGVRNLPRKQWNSLCFEEQETNPHYMDYYYTWDKDEDIFRMFLLFLWELHSS